METPGRPKKVLTEEMLKNLEKAREAARKKRMEQGELTRLKKMVAEKKQAEEILSLKQELDPKEPVPAEREPEIIHKKLKKKPIVIVEESESDSEDEQVVYIKRKSNSRQKEPEAQAQLQQPVSIYAGMHPSQLLGRRRF
jgi:hypothetical protein